MVTASSLRSVPKELKKLIKKYKVNYLKKFDTKGNGSKGTEEVDKEIYSKDCA